MASMGEADAVVVLDTGSTDDTVERLRAAGARVTVERFDPWRFDTARNRSLDLVPEVELSSNDLLIDLARIGLGIAFVPDFCIPKNDEDLFILDLKEQLPSRQMMVAYNESLPVSQAARQFLDML